MKALTFTFLTFILYAATVAQTTYYSMLPAGSNHLWSDNDNWSTDPIVDTNPLLVPGPGDNVVIRDSIYHDAGVGYVHTGDIHITPTGVLRETSCKLREPCVPPAILIISFLE